MEGAWCRALIDQYIMSVLDKQRSVETATQLASDIANMLNDTVTLSVLKKNYLASLNIPSVSAPPRRVPWMCPRLCLAPE
jgi:hypothetical protein